MYLFKSELRKIIKRFGMRNYQFAKFIGIKDQDLAAILLKNIASIRSDILEKIIDVCSTEEKLALLRGLRVKSYRMSKENKNE